MTGGIEKGREGDHCSSEVLLAGPDGREEKSKAIGKELGDTNVASQ